MLKRSLPILVLAICAVLISVIFFPSEPETEEITSEDYLADSLGNLYQGTKEVEVAPPPVVASPLDSAYVWSDSQYSWIATRLLDPETDLVPLSTSSTPALQTNSPTVIDWELLVNIEYRSEYFEEMGMDLYAPIFGEKLKALDGQLVEITGYVIPVVEDGSEVALSANPYASCFFCGKASPASVMSVLFVKPQKRLRTDDYRTIQGRLKLNYDDPNQFYYILKDAQLIRS